MNGSIRQVGLLTLLTVSVCMSGCGKGQQSVRSVEGKVTVNGQPATGALIMLHPVEDKEPGIFPNATVEPDGSFRLTTYKLNDGAPEGEYFATIVWEETYREDGETLSKGDKLKGKYGNKEASGLKVTIKKGKNTLPAFDLAMDK